GGGSRSPQWPQIFADGLGCEIGVAEARETGTLGAAMAAAIGAGLFRSEEEAVAAMTRPAARHVPDPGMREHYERRYALWLRLARALDPYWRELAVDGE